MPCSCTLIWGMKLPISFLILMLISGSVLVAQPVTGIWRGKVKVQGKRQYQLELKLIRNADSLIGSSYYFHSDKQYSRFLVKGYINREGEIIWWDEQLIEHKGGAVVGGQTSLHYVADYNCPGEEIMKLDGSGEGTDTEVHLNKIKTPLFRDEWDDVIDDYPYYVLTPGLIDSVAQQSVTKVYKPATPSPTVNKESNTQPQKQHKTAEGTVAISFPPADKVQQVKPLTVEEKFVARKKILTSEIPVSGDSIRLDFYDHAEIDGDSIALFLNGRMLYQHILLKAEPFHFNIAVADLDQENEMIMVAENLGSIPPNTSLMIAWCNGQRYEARLESTENTSAMIRFIKPAEQVGAKK